MPRGLPPSETSTMCHSLLSPTPQTTHIFYTLHLAWRPAVPVSSHPLPPRTLCGYQPPLKVHYTLPSMPRTQGACALKTPQRSCLKHSDQRRHPDSEIEVQILHPSRSPTALHLSRRPKIRFTTLISCVYFQGAPQRRSFDRVMVHV